MKQNQSCSETLVQWLKTGMFWVSQPEYGLWITCRGFPIQFSTIEKHNSKERTRQRQVKVLKERIACKSVYFKGTRGRCTSCTQVTT